MNIVVSLFGHEIGRVVVDVAPLIALLQQPAPHPAHGNGHRVTDQLVGRTMQMVGRHISTHN